MIEKTKGIIYKYTNKINGKVYIGQTIDENKRKASHKCSKRNDHFHRAIRKYGWDNFDYEVVFTTISSDPDRLKLLLDTMEKYFIKKYNSFKEGYNSTLGGGGNLGYITSEETKKKLSEINKGKRLSEEAKRKIGEASKGRRIPEKSIQKRTQKLNKSVSQNTLEGVFICTYKSASEAARRINGNNSFISSCARGQRKSAYGYIWKYTN